MSYTLRETNEGPPESYTMQVSSHLIGRITSFASFPYVDSIYIYQVRILKSILQGSDSCLMPYAQRRMQQALIRLDDHSVNDLDGEGMCMHWQTSNSWVLRDPQYFENDVSSTSLIASPNRGAGQRSSAQASPMPS